MTPTSVTRDSDPEPGGNGQKRTARKPTHVVGIGASAGGLEALERFFESMPAETGMAFVVVQHLSPDFKSLTDELLARRTPIPIHQVENGMEVERDAIFLIPPRKDMIVADGKLLLTDKDPAQLVTMPIDRFFRSLAQDAGDRAIAVVLSGTGSDGSRGIRDVHEAGGLVVVQAPESAKFDGMPNSAVMTGVVDARLSPEDIPAALLQHIRHPQAESAARARHDPGPESGMDTILRLLRGAYDIDFSHYKPDTVQRRVERRLALNQTGLDDYAARLADDPDELNALYKDLLIGVTRFFRDRDAFGRLEDDVLPALLGALGPDDEFRAWVAGCATGEEAYSLAVLVQDVLARLHKFIPVKVFATDVHRASLDFAGAGVYPAEALNDLAPDRRDRYFVRRGESYVVTPELRKTVVFAPHNVLKDAPFTKLDLISCRNLLIYFQPPAQKKVLSLFHFGLKTGGVLFLGPSESPGELADEFESADAHWKVYRKRRDVRLAADIRLPVATSAHGRPRPAGPAPVPANAFDNQLLGTYDTLLNEFMPPSVLVNERREIVHCFHGANRYLRPREGRFSADVLDMVEPELRTALTGALQRAFRARSPAVYNGLRLTLPEGERLVNVTVKPVKPPRADALHALICLEERDAPAPVPQSAEEIDRGQASREHLLSLETELRLTKENLQASVEEMETSNEELQATNEELVASNEELQSTNEELHSVNEELFTVNAEYQKKIAELTELTADIDNLFTCTQVHTIFLDRDLRVRKFTPHMGEKFNLLPQDVGRRLDSFTHGIDHPALMGDVEVVLRTGETREREVRDARGRWYLLRVLPYRVQQTTDGVVLTLIDVSNVKGAEAESRLRGRHLSSILRNSPGLITIKDLQGRYVLTDDSFRKLVGAEPVGKTDRDLFAPAIADALADEERRVLSEAGHVQAEVQLPHPDGPRTYLSSSFPLCDEDGRVTGLSSIKTDVTELKAAEARAREAVVQRDRFLAMLSHELRNPLAAILNSAEVLSVLAGAGAAAPAQAGEWVRVIKRRARHMTRLLDDLLDVSRITRNKIEIRKQAFDLRATVPDVLEETRPWFEERRLGLEVVPCAEPLPVEGDPDRLQQIQVNLLGNAAKYTEPGGTVRYALAREGDDAVVRVRDNGIGIAAEMLDKVFDLFVQADDTLDRSKSGIGVGLTLVRSIVGLHGGRVRAFSDGVGTGTELVVWLPLSRRPLDEPAPAVPAPRPAAGGTTRVLVVDDDEDVRGSMRQLLEFDGYEVRTAADGPEALAVLAAHPTDVAVVDIGLPEMDGYELARRVRRERGAGAPYLIALTGYGRPSDRQAAFDAGFDAHLTKPLRPDQLAGLLASLREGKTG